MHTPIFKNTNCSTIIKPVYLEQEQNNDKIISNSYHSQLQCVNNLTIATLKIILKKWPNANIFLHGDHGIKHIPKNLRLNDEEKNLEQNKRFLFETFVAIKMGNNKILNYKNDDNIQESFKEFILNL